MEHLKEMIYKLDKITCMFYRNDQITLKLFGDEFQLICNDVFKICGMIEQKTAQELVSAVRRLIVAFEQKDVIALADIIKYEIENKLIYVLKKNADSMSNTEIKEQYHSNTQYLILDKGNYNKNLSALERIQGKTTKNHTKKFCDKYAIKDDYNTIMDCNCNLLVKKADVWWRLNSLYDVHNAAIEWTANIKKINYKSILIIIGISNVEYIRQILAELQKDNILIIFEPDKNIFALNMLYNQMYDILSDERCYLFVKDVNMNIFTHVFSLLDYTMVELINFYVLPNYDFLYSNEINEFLNICKKQIDYMAICENTVILKNENIISNVIRNLQIIENSSSLLQLKEQFSQEEKENIPVIIVAAGPSLDKNIEELKRAKGKALIIGVDSSMRMLLKHGIIPDLVVTIDPDKERVLFEDDRTDSIPIVYCAHSTFDILKKNCSKHILFSSINYIQYLFDKFQKKVGEIDSGGSVANAAFSVGVYIGFKNIILIGQDLAFTNNKKHASVVYEEKEICEDEKDQYEEIEGIDGNSILTYANFRVYRDWFEAKINQNQHINVINATEGGALIHGAINMTLKSAINQFCQKQNKINFSKKIMECRQILNQQDKIKYREIVSETVLVCDKLKESFERCKALYQLIIDQVNKNTLTDMLLTEYLDKIKGIIEQNVKEPIMEFVSCYARQEELKASQGLYDCDDDRKDLAMRGVRVLDAYIKAVDKVREKYFMLIMEMKIPLK